MKKSPAEDKKGPSVEDIFRDGFAGAEGTPPPPRLWENVARELENQELQSYRQQVKWYRSLAAAFLLLLISAGIVLWKQSSSVQKDGTSTLAQQQEVRPGAAGSDVGQPKLNNLKEAPAKRATENLAAVSEPVYENNELNKSHSAGIASKRRNSTSAKSVASTLPEENAAPDAGNISSEQMAVANPVVEEKQMIPALPAVSSPIEAADAGRKSFSRALVNSLASPNLSLTGVDSTLLAVPKKSMLQQKEAVALVQPAPAEGEPTPADAPVQKWSLTMKYNPSYTYAPVRIQEQPNMNAALFLSQPQVYHQYQEAVEEYNNSYSPAYSYSTMVGASYKLNDKWQFESGLLFSQNEATTTHSYLLHNGNVFTGGAASNTPRKSTPIVASALSDRAPEAATSYTLLSRTSQYNIRYKYQQVGLPLRVAYKLNKNKLYAFVSGGLNLNVLLQNSIMPESDQVESVRYGFNENDSPFNTLQVASSTSIGVGYEVSKKMSILVAPEFIYSLTPMVRDGQEQPNAYQLGVAIGGKWRLTQ